MATITIKKSGKTYEVRSGILWLHRHRHELREIQIVQFPGDDAGCRIDVETSKYLFSEVWGSWRLARQYFGEYHGGGGGTRVLRRKRRVFFPYGGDVFVIDGGGRHPLSQEREPEGPEFPVWYDHQGREHQEF